MRDENIKELETLLRRFVAGDDRSPEYVRGIGDFLTERCTPDVDLPADLYEELEITTACYRPGGVHSCTMKRRLPPFSRSY